MDINKSCKGIQQEVELLIVWQICSTVFCKTKFVFCGFFVIIESNKTLEVIGGYFLSLCKAKAVII